MKRTMGCVEVSFIVMSEGFPKKKIYLKKHSLDYVGSSPTRGLITGICKRNSRQLALQMTAKWTKTKHGSPGKNTALLLDTNFKGTDYEGGFEHRGGISRQVFEKTGWINFDRLTSNFREEIKDTWLNWISKDYGIEKSDLMQQNELSIIALSYPEYVAKMMKKDLSIKGVVHPVRPVIDPDSCLWAATIRYEPERFLETGMRFLPLTTVVL